MDASASRIEDRIVRQLEAYEQERSALVAEANERTQKNQLTNAEHNTRIVEIQTRVIQIHGGMLALQQLLGESDEVKEH